MAGERTDEAYQAEGSHEPRECMACRGTGEVISNLGGTPSNVECPWCGGSGVRRREIDAQNRWLAERAEAADAQAPAGADAPVPAAADAPPPSASAAAGAAETPDAAA